MRRIATILTGSRLYGTNHKNSDYDIRGVVLEPVEALLGFQKFEQVTYPEWEDYGIKSDDVVFYGLRKFLLLAMNSNPNIIELLYAKPIYHDFVWDLIVNNRNKIVSTKVVHTFSGYAHAQMQRIHLRRDWIDNAPTKPDPHEYGMSYNAKGAPKWETEAGKRNYKEDLANYQAYTTWAANRNPERLKYELQYGYDTKHAMHLYRLILEAEELLLTGDIKFPLSFSPLLLDVRDGKYSYERVLEFGKNGHDYLKAIEASGKCVLNHDPDEKAIEEILIRIYRGYLRGDIRWTDGKDVTRS